MDWARDQLGQLVHASQTGSLSYYVLSCPLCREPVYRRAGQQRRAHFAHFSNRAKPECENYHPPAPYNSAASLPNVDARYSGSQPNVPPAAILLDLNDDRVAIYVRLPAFPGVADSEESIEIRSGLGVRTYSLRSLCRSRIIPVTLRLPLVEVFTSSISGASGDAKAVVEAGINAFRKEGNFFRIGESAGRLLAPDEPLEWGDRYNLLTQRRLPSESRVFGVNIEVVYEKREWLLYEVTLPSLEWAIPNQAKGAIERYLNRRLSPPRQKAYFIDPPPHHIELDGTHVFPDGTQQVVLRTVGVDDIRIQSIGSSERFHIEREQEICRISIAEGEIGDFAIQANGRDLVLGRVEPCPVFSPRGVQVLVDSQPFDIFCGDLPSVVRNRAQQKIEITFPAERVARLFEMTEGVWKTESASLTFSTRSREPSFDAKNFGSLTLPFAELVGTELTEADDQLTARRIWISGLLTRFAEGGATLYRVQACSAENATPLRIDDPETEWLRPYVAVAWPN